MTSEKKKLPSNITQRIILYCIGLFVLAMGVTISINSNLGVSPTNSLPYVLSLVLKMEMATTVIIAFSTYTLMQILILGKEFKWINITQILFSTIFGYFVDFTNFLLGDFQIPTFAGQLVMMVASILFIAVGISLYLEAKLVSMPMEGLAQAITYKLKKVTFGNVKMSVDIASVTIATILSFAFLGGLKGVGIGTIISAFCVGKCIPFVKKYTEPMTSKLYKESK